MRITLEVINQAPQSMNPNKERMICLRGLKIALIENLGATTDNFECIDLCDNDLTKIANIPPLKRLNSLLLANNRISRIEWDIFESLPNLTSLVLTNNKIDSLAECAPLGKAKRLERLTMTNNPIVSNPHFRLFVIHSVPTLRFLNFSKIRPKDREEANLMFSGESGEKLKSELASQQGSAEGSEPMGAGGRQMGDKSKQLTADNTALIKIAISRAQTIEEVSRLEAALKSGVLPPELSRGLDQSMPIKPELPPPLFPGAPLGGLPIKPDLSPNLRPGMPPGGQPGDPPGLPHAPLPPKVPPPPSLPGGQSLATAKRPPPPPPPPPEKPKDDDATMSG